MIRLRDTPEDDHKASDSHAPPPTTSDTSRKPRGVPFSPPSSPPTSAAETTVYNPAQVAAMWGVAHDKVLEFIKTGELEAFNVASKRSRRPQFKVTLAAVSTRPTNSESGPSRTRKSPTIGWGRSKTSILSARPAASRTSPRTASGQTIASTGSSRRTTSSTSPIRFDSSSSALPSSARTERCDWRCRTNGHASIISAC